MPDRFANPAGEFLRRLDSIVRSSGGPVVLWEGKCLQTRHAGIGSYAASLSHSLEKRGVRPILLARHDDESLYPHADTIPVGGGIPGRRIGATRRSWRMACRVAKRHPDRRFVFHGLANTNGPAWGNRPGNLRVVLTVHDPIPLLPIANVGRLKRAYYRFGWRRVLPRADAIVCISRWTADEVRRRLPQVWDRIIVAPNGRPSDSDRPRRRVPNQDRPPTDAVSLLCISRSEAYKRLEFLIELAVASEFRLDIVTDLAGVDRLSSLGDRRGVADRVRLHTGLSDSELRTLWERTDVYVQPSLLEGYCLPVAEALASRRPVVYTGGSGVDEVAGRTVACRLVPGDNAEAWVEAVRRMHVEAGRDDWDARVAEHLSSLSTWDEHADGVVRAYGLDDVV